MKAHSGFWQAWITAVLVALLPTLASAAVRDVPAPNLKQAVQSDRLSIVLFTSPDVGCGYCTGQSQLFDDFAKSFKGNAQLLRVQWSPWRAAPPELQLYGGYGIPNWVVVKSGRVLGESSPRLPDTQAIQTLLDRALSPQAQSAVKNNESPPVRAGSPTATAPASAALSEIERSALATFARLDLMKAALDACASAFPARRDSDTKRIAAWQEKNNAVLQQGARLMLKRSSREDAAVMKDISETEFKKLRELAPMNQATPEGCDKVAAELN